MAGLGFLTVSDYLGVLDECLCGPLVSRRQLSYLHVQASRLPGNLMDSLVLESRLGGGSEQVDLSVSVTDRGRPLLVGRAPDAQGALAPFFVQREWRRIADFAESWADASSLAHENVDHIWLEFDVDGPPHPVPVPSLFLGTSRITRSAGPPLWLTDTVLPCLTGAPLSSEVRRSLFRCVDALPDGASLKQIGVMLPRPPGTIRIVAHRMAARDVAPYLETIGWPGSPRPIAQLVGRLSGLVDRVCPSLDVGEAIAPRLGLECYNDDADLRPSLEDGRIPLLDFLVDEGLCTDAERDGLLAYYGFSDHRAQPERWPAAVHDAARLAGDAYLRVIRRGLGHVKLVYEPERPMHAKAYLYARPLWVALSDLARVSGSRRDPRT